VVGCKGRLKPIEEGNLRCLQPSLYLVEIEPLDTVNLTGVLGRAGVIMTRPRAYALFSL
jgi:hypothetical protein